jgi:hypothetical protein
MHRPFQIVCLLVVLSSTFSYSQPESQIPAVVTFTLDFPTSAPEHYSIRVQSDGPTHYQSSGHFSPDSDETDSFNVDFTLGAETRQKIFDLAAKASYFKKDVDSHHKGLAFTGKKTLAYKDAQNSGEASYNYSPVPAVQDLTALLQSLSSTLEFGHRLQYDRQYQKLALDEELKRMEDLARTNVLVEIAAIQSILDQIIADQSVMNVTRARAQRLLERAGAH